MMGGKKVGYSVGPRPAEGIARVPSHLQRRHGFLCPVASLERCPVLNVDEVSPCGKPPHHGPCIDWARVVVQTANTPNPQPLCVPARATDDRYATRREQR